MADVQRASERERWWLKRHSRTLAQATVAAYICNASCVTTSDDFIAAQRALAEDWGFDSYEAGLRSWIATVAIVEAGYVGEWEEYVHELMARDYVNELMRLSPSSRPALEQDLALWDARFRAATVQEEKPHLPIAEGEPGWWQYRSPRSWRRPGSEEMARLRGL